MTPIKYSKILLIEDNVARVATSLPTLTTGEIGVFSTDGRLLNTTTVLAETKVRVITGSSLLGNEQGAGTVIDLADVDIAKLNAVVFKAQTQTLDYIGYNGTTGSLDVINDNVYQVWVKDLDSTVMGSIGWIYSAYYKSSAVATEQEIADGLVLSLAGSLQASSPKFASAFLISTAQSLASTAASGTLTVTNGSTTISASGATAATDYPIGSYIRFAAAVTGGTAPVYKVVNVVNATGIITLAVPYQGVSGTFLVTTHSSISVAAALAASYGIAVLGLVQPFGNVNLSAAQEFYVSKFKVSLGGFTNTVVTQVSFASKGSGEPADVAVLERSLIGQQGFMYHNTWPPAVFPNQTSLAAAFGYAMVNIVYTKKGNQNVVSTQPAIRNEMMIAARQISAPVSPAVIVPGAVVSSGMTGVTGVLDVLGTWLGLGTIPLTY